MLVLLLLLTTSCAHNGPSPDDGVPNDTGSDTAEVPIVWADCGEGTECADVLVPVDHTGLASAEISVHLRRLPAEGSPTRALWLVVGGPGDPGTPIVPDLSFFQDVFPSMEIYSFDHRGTGSSAPLQCTAAESETSEEGTAIADSEWPGCLAELQADGAPLGQMTVSQAADDLGALIERVNPDTPAVVWGISYGSYLVDRYAMRHPDQPEAVILDGIVPPDWTFAEFDTSMDTTGRAYLALCEADASCASHLEGDPLAFTDDTLAALAAMPCGAFDASLARQALGALLLTGDDRAAIPAVIARLHRCSADDQTALDHLLGTFPTEDTQNEALLVNIATSELWPAEGPSASDASATLEGYVMATGVSAWVAARAEQWPVYELDSPDPSAARPSIPALLLHGGLDPTVQLDRNAADRALWPMGRSVTPPGSGHVTLNFSDCAADAYVQFLDDPAGAEFGDCADEAFTEDFDLPSADATRLFGVAEGWPG